MMFCRWSAFGMKMSVLRHFCPNYPMKCASFLKGALFRLNVLPKFVRAYKQQLMGLIMLKILQQIVLFLCCLGVFTSSYATEVMAFGQGLKPNENGLPPPLEKPLYLSVCLFDILGKNGDVYSRAKDLTLLARRWNVFVDIQVFMDERITAENFKAGQCEAAGISTLRAP